MSEWGISADILPQLIGAWRLDRLIEIKADNTKVIMVGQGIFSPCSDHFALYTEMLDVRLASGVIEGATQSYVYDRLLSGFSVSFNETPVRLFHTIELHSDVSGWEGQASHQCGADHYLSAYSFLVDGNFRVVHKVGGPRKDYVSTTSFTRV